MRIGLIGGGVALTLSYILGPAVLALLRRGQVIDHPTARSSHVAPTPRGGGIALAVGALAALAVAPEGHAGQRWAIAVTAAVFAIMGLVEDIIGIRALRRLGIQFVAAAFAGWFLLDNLAGPALWQVAFAIGEIVWLVSFVNAFNFMDGIDGISVAQSVGVGASWLLVGAYTHTPVLASGGAIVAGAALGFAPYNLPHARMFLGDVGSYFLGAWLGAVALLGIRAGVPPEAVLAPLALYVADTGATLVRRVARGERWYLPHRDHAYQRIGDAGWSHVQVAAFVGACIAACGALGAVSLNGSAPARVAADLAVAAVIGSYLLAPRWLARNGSPVAVA